MRDLARVMLVATATSAMVLAGMGAAGAGSRQARNIPSGATHVSFSAGQTKHIDVKLHPSGAVSGKVTLRGSSTPISDVGVSLVGSNGISGSNGYTDSSGKYTVYGVFPGKYRVCVFYASQGSGAPYGYVPACSGTTAPATGYQPPHGTPTVSVSVGHLASANITMTKAGAIAGKTNSANGKPLTNVAVSVYKSGRVVGSSGGFSPNPGAYSVTQLPPGKYLVCFNGRSASGGPSKTGYLSECWKNKPWDGASRPSSSKTVTVKANKSTNGVNSSLASGGAIAGKITNAKTHKPASGASVLVFKGKSLNNFVSIAPNGTYQVNGLNSGQNYRVCATGSGFGSSTTYAGRCFKHASWNGRSLPSGATDVSVKTGKVHKHVNIALTPKKHKVGSISGKLTDSGGHPLGSANVEVFKGTNQVTGTTTKSNGTYAVKNLAPGSNYTVCFDTSIPSSQSSAPASGYSSVCHKTSKWVPGSKPASSANKVRVKAGKTTKNVNAKAGKGAAISGTVTISNGDPASFVSVYVVNANGALVESGQSDFEDGTYTVKGITPGSGYRVCFRYSSFGSPPPNGLGYLSQCYNNKNWDGSLGGFLGG